MSQNSVQQFIKQYNLFENDQIQQTQLQHRYALAEAFGIKKGMKVLEIGCGQGDMTVVLADTVGESGHVTAIDIAPPDYGAPFTLGEAHERINQSKLGARSDFHLETDFLEMNLDKQYDAVVLSHCSWYFHDPAQLLAYFKRIRSISNMLCFAEWDMQFEKITQRGHFCAASILALYSQFTANDGNIQNLFGRSEIGKMIEDAGMKVEQELGVDAHYLQDSQWEIDYAMEVTKEFSAAPFRIQTLVQNYTDILGVEGTNESLDSFVIVAK
ncbi:SAM-dependent methyltransferase [Jeotgalibacillus malaysiensis]|uniref:SAM-dependent methyltransferase n=1 Tax=Jeotgalibacillus malaysiensis TaxID=1508404 RepID=UPI00384C3125